MTARHSGRRWIVWGGLTAAAAVLILGWPATTRQGVNFQVTAYREPLYVKAIDFLHRHERYRAIAQAITRGRASERDRMLAVFDWTHAHIRPAPKDWPVVDDHILDIIIRGYGLGDQMADVFTTLSTYAGVPAFWRPLHFEETGEWLIFSFARVDGRWIVCDVANHLIFTDASGRWADVQTLLDHPELAAGLVSADGVPYAPHVAQLRPFSVPQPMRAQIQMPWPRLLFEARRMTGLVGAR